MASPTQTVKALQNLCAAGLSSSILKDLHHDKARKVTFASAIKYFSKPSDLGEANIVFSNRVIFVEQQHRATGEGFEAIVARARQRFP